jgi:hypothetical protein
MIKIKVKFTLEQATKAQRGSRGVALLFFNLGAGWGCVVNATPRPIYPRKETWYPSYIRLDGPQGRSAQTWKMAPHRESIPGPSSP